MSESTALPIDITPRSFWLVIHEHRPAVITIAPTGTHYFACGQEEAWQLTHVNAWIRQIHVVREPTNAPSDPNDNEKL